jgi:hypothetical protein
MHQLQPDWSQQEDVRDTATSWRTITKVKIFASWRVFESMLRRFIIPAIKSGMH